MSYYIEKQFEASCAHRVDVQSLCMSMTDGATRMNPCKSVHGHGVTFLIGLDSDHLVNSMLIDYNMLKFIKKALNEHYDHRFTLAKTDPLYDFLVVEAYNQLAAYAVENGFAKEFIPLTLKNIDDLDGGEGYRCAVVKVPDEYRASGHCLVELLDSYTIMDIKTTSENLAHWMFNVVKNRLQKFHDETNDPYMKEVIEGIRVAKVSYKESPKSIAVYSE